MNGIFKRGMTYLKNGDFLYHLKISIWRNRKLFKIYGLISGTQKIENKKIVFSNMNGVGYGGDPKYICDYIIENKLEYDLVWLVDDFLCKTTEMFPDEVKIVDIYSIKALKELSTAHFWIDNCRKLVFPPKKNNQVYLQTWHGVFPTKYIEKDAEKYLDKSYIKSAKADSMMIDYLISGCKYKSETYRKNFYYSGKILDIGTPKEDIFFDSQKIANATYKVKNYYKINQDTSIILYAPTFRKNNSLEVYDMDYNLVVNAFERLCGCKCKLMVRLHPNLIEESRKMLLPESVMNVTEYPDMQELLCASDYIISDYSSTLDYSIFDKPIFLYCPDLKEYIKDERNLYIKIQDLPFSIAETNEDLDNSILEFDKAKYECKLHEAYKKYGLCESGNASRKIIDLFESLCEE